MKVYVVQEIASGYVIGAKVYLDREDAEASIRKKPRVDYYEVVEFDVVGTGAL